ncbi:MAG: glycosyltransferase family 4 protein [Patescibacteria group bacterium]|nr:glycosyltransferase family 4 protein [Patescibacteria group bacterium]
MKRVLVFSLAYLPHTGGAEVALKEITDRIPGIEFHVVTLNFGGESREEKIGSVLVHRVGNGASYLAKILFPLRAARVARRLHRAHQFDALWAMMSYMLFPIMLLRFSGVRTPYLLTLQEGDSWQHMFSRWFILPLRPLLSAGFRHASEVQAISTYLAQWAKKMGYPGRVEVVPNGCDTTRFATRFPAEDRRAFWSEKHIDSAGTILITTSRLVRKNAVDVVIRALALLPSDVQFVILGEGEERSSLAKLVNDLGVSKRAHFLGSIPNLETVQYLHASDIFVRPSRSEGMGNSFIEAMAAGLPVIATQEGGIADFLFDAKRNPDKETTGWAVDVDSPEQIAAAVKEILSNPERAARVKENAKKLVAENYDWNLIARRMKALFDRLLENR